VLLAVAGWITFGVGFGLRNFEYRERAASDEHLSRAGFDNAAEADFIFLWLFGITAPILMIITFFDLFCGIKATQFIVFFLLPVFMVSAGGVLFFNGLQLYEFYVINDVADDLPGNLALHEAHRVMQRVHVVCGDVTRAYLGPVGLIDLDIHGSDKFIPIEFAGAATSVMFYWAFLLAIPFFTSTKKSENYDKY